MDFISFITSPEYRAHWRRTYAEQMVQQRHEVVSHHVCVQDIFYFSKTEWKKKSFICIDGIRIEDFVDTKDKRARLEDLRKQYYLLHRHTILNRV